METRKYTVDRDKIYVGSVFKTYNIFNRYFFDVNNSSYLDFDSAKCYRSILFTLNENNFADDLLYNSPLYPVLNITDNNYCLDLPKPSMLVTDEYPLGELLAYFGYGEELGYEDIVKIRETFFAKQFAKKNSELFGMKKVDPRDYKYYRYGTEEISNPFEIELCILREKINQIGKPKYSKCSGKVVSREYFDVLNHLGDKTLREIMKDSEQSRNAFTPPSREGVKSLRKLK